MDVKPVEVARDNFDEVIALELEETQKKYLPSNRYSIAESGFSQSVYLRAISVDGEVAGFLEYQFRESGAFDEGECTVWRFMIDRKRQRTGIGRIAMGMLLDEIKAH